MRLLIISTLFFISCNLVAQNVTIKGTVADADGHVIAYANIIAGDQGTTSDDSGHFILTVPWQKKVVISCSFLGYKEMIYSTDPLQGATVLVDFILVSSNSLLETAVVTAGRFGKSLSKTTVSLEVLKPQLLESTNTVSIDDGLNRLSGVDIIDGQANIRGGSGFSYGAGSRVLLLLNGMPIMQSDAAFPNWLDMPVENIGQVEILKGAASALYGSSAMNGIINIRTAQPKTKPYLRIAPFYTTYFGPKDATQKWWDKAPYSSGMSAVFRQRIKNIGVSVGGFYLSEEGYKQGTYKKYGRGFVGLDYHFSKNMVAGIHGYYNPGSTATFFYWNDDTTGILKPAPNTLSESRRTRFNIDPYLKISDNLGGYHKLQGRYLGVNNKNSDDQGVQSNMRFVEYQYLKKFNEIGLRVTAGGAYTGTFVEAELYGDTTYSSSNRALYLQTEKDFGALTLVGGVRYETNVLKSPEVIPTTVFGVTTYDTIPDGVTQETQPVFRLGLNWQLAKASFLRASFGQGYRYPTVAEKFISTAINIISITPNVMLNSERGYTLEAGFKQGFKMNGLKGFLDASFFYSRYKDMMEFSFGGVDGSTFSFASVNIGNTEILGAELTIAGTAKIGPLKNSFMTGVMFLDPQYTDFSERIKNSSSSEENILKYRFKNSWKLDWQTEYKHLAIGFSVIHNSKTEAVDAFLQNTINGAERFRESHGGFTRVDARASFKLSPKYKIAIMGENISNQTYSQRIGKLEAPFNLGLRLDYTPFSN